MNLTLRHSLLVPSLTNSLPSPAEAQVVDARNQVCLHMEVHGSGIEWEAVEDFL